MEDAAIGTFARTWCRAFSGDSGFGEVGGEYLKVAGMRGPADETRGGEFFELCWQLGLRGSLLRIWRDDFEITMRAEREKGVLRAAAWMNSTECGADAAVLFYEIDAALEIVAAEKNVIEHGWHLIDQRHVGFLRRLLE